MAATVLSRRLGHGLAVTYRSGFVRVGLCRPTDLTVVVRLPMVVLIQGGNDENPSAAGEGGALYLPAHYRPL